MPYQDSDVTGGKVRLKHSITAGETIAAGGITPSSVASGTHYFSESCPGQDATMTATNAVGEGPASTAVEVTTA